MSGRILLPSKQVADSIVVNFPFQNQMQFGEVVTGAVVTIVPWSGDDPNPTTMLVGTPDHTTGLGLYVLQGVKNGISGVIYRLVCTVTTSLSNAFTCDAQLAVLDDSGEY